MKIVLLVEGGRKAPAALFSQSKRWGVELKTTPVADTDWRLALEEAYAVMLLVPAWGANAFLSPVALWQQYLQMEAPSKRLILASFEATPLEMALTLRAASSSLKATTSASNSSTLLTLSLFGLKFFGSILF